MGIDLIVFCFASMDCFHVEGVAQDKRNVFLCAEVGNPIPGEDTLNGNDNIFSERSDRLEKDVGVCFDVPMQNDLPLLGEDA
jgi:hypothetical protein